MNSIFRVTLIGDNITSSSKIAAEITNSKQIPAKANDSYGVHCSFT